MKNNIYKKIFFSFSVIIILYTAIILFVYINKEISRQKYESTVGVEFYLERESSRIDSQIENAIDSTQILSDNQKIQELANLETADYQVFSDVFDQMKENVFSDYQTGYNLGITPGIDGKVVGLNGYFDFWDYLSFIGIPKDNPEVAEFFKAEDQYRIRVICVDQKIFLLRKIYQANKPASLYFIINWDPKALKSKENLYPTGELFFYDSEASQQVSSNASSSRMEPFLPLDAMKKNQIGHQTIGEDTAFWKGSGVVPSLSFVYVVHSQVLSQIPIDTIWTILFVLLVLLALGSILTIMFSRSNYKPYRKIIGEIQNDDTSVGDVEEILHKIEDLKSSSEDFGHFQEHNIEDIREVFFKNVLLGKYSIKELRRIIGVLSLDSLASGGLIAVLTLQGKSTDEASLSERELLKARQRIIEYGTKQNRVELFVQPIDSSNFALVYASKEQTVVLGLIDDLQNLLKKNLHLSSQFVLSVPFEGIDQFSATFRDVYSLNLDSVFKPEQIIVNRTLDKGMNYTYSIEAEHRLIHLVKSKQLEDAANLIEDILRNNFIERKLALHAIESLKQTLVTTLNRILQLDGIEDSEFHKDNQLLFDQLIGTDPKELYRVFMELFQNAFRVVEDISEKSQTLLDHILMYIEEHYKEDLALSDLAEHFRLTESYLSKLIKGGTGITFKNYLNQLKVNHAKELLKNKKMLVNQVAEAVGVKNVNTFIRMFKQYEGITPGKYQSLKRDENH